MLNLLLVNCPLAPKYLARRKALRKGRRVKRAAIARRVYRLTQIKLVHRNLAMYLLPLTINHPKPYSKLCSSIYDGQLL